MDLLQSVVVQCPYCGEALDVEVDCSVDDQVYIEDCQVCCRPITLHASVEDGRARLMARHEND